MMASASRPGFTAAKSVRRSGLRDEVYREILRLITEGDLEEGEPLRVEALAGLLEVSPTPVREALVQLETTGLVEYVANKGYRVSPAFTPDAMRAIMDARLVLETSAARRAAAQQDRSFAEDLAGIIRAQRAAAEEISLAGGERRAALRRYLEEDHRFHDTIFRECGNPFLARLARSIDAQSQRARQSFVHGVDDANEATAEHERVLEAIRAGDADAAEAAMRDHLERVLGKSLSHF